MDSSQHMYAHRHQSGVWLGIIKWLMCVILMQCCLHWRNVLPCPDPTLDHHSCRTFHTSLRCCMRTFSCSTGMQRLRRLPQDRLKQQPQQLPQQQSKTEAEMRTLTIPSSCPLTLQPLPLPSTPPSGLTPLPTATKNAASRSGFTLSSVVHLAPP